MSSALGLIGEILCTCEQRNEYHSQLETIFQTGYIQDQPRFVSIQSRIVEFKLTSSNINQRQPISTNINQHERTRTFTAPTLTLAPRLSGKDLKSTVKFADVAGLEQAKAGRALIWIRWGAKVGDASKLVIKVV